MNEKRLQLLFNLRGVTHTHAHTPIEQLCLVNNCCLERALTYTATTHSYTHVLKLWVRQR